MVETMSEASFGKKPKKRIFYFDALRALAIISVILYHVFMNSRGLVFNQIVPFPTVNWILTDITGVCFRIGVDLFLMLSGALSLGRVWDIKPFLAKRLPRITLPFLFWGFVLTVALVIVNIIWPGFWRMPYDTLTLMSFLTYLYENYMAMHMGFNPYWFFWMILGTYLIMPILNKWLLHSDLKEAEYFLGLWMLTCLFDYTLMTPFPVKLSYFSGPIGMVVLGYYLRHTERDLLNNQYFAILLILIGAIGLVILSYLNSSVTSMQPFEKYHILRVVEVIGVFLLFKNAGKFNIHINFFDNPEGVFRKSIFSIAKYSYGIYLVHRVFLCVLYKLLAFEVPYKVLLASLFVGSLLISWGLLAALNRIPYLNQVIGAK